MSHVNYNPKLPCRRCKHIAERHRNVPALQHANGAWSPEHEYCNENCIYIKGIGYTTNQNCGCNFFDPMDNLEYLETLI